MINVSEGVLCSESFFGKPSTADDQSVRKTAEIASSSPLTLRNKSSLKGS